MLKIKLKYFKVLIIIFILNISFFGIIPFVFSSPDDIILYPVADTWIRQSNPDGNYGFLEYIWIGTQTDANIRTFIKFDLSSLSGEAIISLATLRVYCYADVEPSVPNTNVQVRRVSDDSWIEDDITWNNQKAYGVIEDTIIPAVGWVEWNITGFVQDEWDNDKTISVMLRVITEDYDGTTRRSCYRSREYDSGSVKPQLYIEYSVVSDNKPFYSDVGFEDVTQVGESVDFWVFWEDDFNLETCKFETNNTGVAVNHTLTVSGVSSWANKTLQLNFTANTRVEWKWFCSDNASQWNWTSTYSLITTSLYITFNFNNSTMGKFYVDYVNTANETQKPYNYNESILLDGIQLSSDYSFLNFTWTGDNSLINNYNYYTSGNNTIWCYFGLSGVGGIDESYFALGFVIAGCAILFIIIVLKSDKKEK